MPGFQNEERAVILDVPFLFDCNLLVGNWCYAAAALKEAVIGGLAYFAWEMDSHKSGLSAFLYQYQSISSPYEGGEASTAKSGGVVILPPTDANIISNFAFFVKRFFS